jgi:hypothetical protein
MHWQKGYMHLQQQKPPSLPSSGAVLAVFAGFAVGVSIGYGHSDSARGMLARELKACQDVGKGYVEEQEHVLGSLRSCVALLERFRTDGALAAYGILPPPNENPPNRQIQPRSPPSVGVGQGDPPEAPISQQGSIPVYPAVSTTPGDMVLPECDFDARGDVVNCPPFPFTAQ